MLGKVNEQQEEEQEEEKEKEKEKELWYDLRQKDLKDLNTHAMGLLKSTRSIILLNSSNNINSRKGNFNSSVIYIIWTSKPLQRRFFFIGFFLHPFT